MGRGTTVLVLSILASSAHAEAPLDLARYDCTRTDDDTTFAGDTLAAKGFRIATVARFGNVNLTLVDPKTSVRANCFLRAPQGR